MLAEFSQRLDVIFLGENVESSVAQENFGVVFTVFTVDVSSFFSRNEILRAGELKLEPSLILGRRRGSFRAR